MIKWEYVSTRLSIVALENNGILDSFGKEGWELATIANNRAYFKRPIAEDE